MSFWNRLKLRLQQFMMGRNGVDSLSTALLVLALILMMIASFTLNPIIHLLSLVAYGFCIFRMLSKNTVKRAQENRKYLETFGKLKTTGSQSFQRLKNTKDYKYVTCPECKTLLRLPRKNAAGKRLGTITVTCSKCRHSFETKI